jgi:hypothetical protein
MRTILKTAAALLVGLGALGVSTAFADDDGDRDRSYRERDHRDGDRDYRDHDRRDGDHQSDDRRAERRYEGRRDHDRRDNDQRYGDRDYRDHDRRDGDHQSDDRRAERRYEGRRDHDRRDNDQRYGDRRSGDYRYDGGNYRGGRPARCTIDHDHRYHNRDYYTYYPKDRYYRADPSFSIYLSLGDRGYYDRSGSYYDRPYYDSRGYRDHGRVVKRDVYRLRGFQADAVLVEEVFYGRGGSDLVCTVTARGPDARYVPYGQLRRIAARECSHRADIRVYA